jgi:hypothetical protein
MDYASAYNKLITRGQLRILNPPFETHHIIPKCVGGSNMLSNLVNLTPEEHYTAHQLLLKIYPGNKKLIFAAHMMTVGLPTARKNKAYGWIKRKMSESMTGAGNHMYGRKLSDERKSKSALVGEQHPMFGKHHTEATKKKISDKNKGSAGLVGEANGMFGKLHTNATKEKISQNNPWTGSAGKGIHPNNGRHLSEDQKTHLRKLFTGVKLSEETVSCPHCSKTGGISNMTRYHLDNCKGKK